MWENSAEVLLLLLQDFVRIIDNIFVFEMKLEASEQKNFTSSSIRPTARLGIRTGNLPITGSLLRPNVKTPGMG